MAEINQDNFFDTKTEPLGIPNKKRKKRQNANDNSSDIDELAFDCQPKRVKNTSFVHSSNSVLVKPAELFVEAEVDDQP